MASERQAKKRRSQESEQGAVSMEASKPLVLELDMSKYSPNIQHMTNKELVQIFDFGVAVKESFTMTLLENSTIIKKELRKQMEPIHEELERNMKGLSASLEENLKGSERQMLTAVSEMKHGLTSEVLDVSKKVLPIGEMEKRITQNISLWHNDISIKVENLAKEFQKPAKKGAIGENMVMSILKNGGLPNYTFHDVSTERAVAGDIDVTSPEGRHFLIEVKNHERIVPKKEIEKFKEDVRCRGGVKVGIMLSMKSGITTKCKNGVFEMNHSDGKYFIYIPSALEQKEVLIWSVRLANQLSGLDSELPESQSQKLQKLCESFRDKVNHVKECRDKIKSMKKAIEGLEESIDPLFQIIENSSKELKAILKSV